MSFKQVTNITIKNLKPREKKYTVPVADSLFLMVTPKGKKVFFIRYSDENKRRTTLNLGDYPTLSLADAIKMAEEKLLQAKEIGNLYKAEQQKIKIEAQQIEKNVKSNFVKLIQSYIQNQIDFKIWSELHARRQKMRIDKHVLPCFNSDVCINDLKLDDIYSCLQKIVSLESYETAKKMYRVIKGVFEYADNKGLLSVKNLGVIIRLERFAKSLPKSQEKTRYQVMTEKEIGILIAKLEAYEQSTFPVQIAAKVAPYLALRPSELCTLEWQDINFEEREIFVPAHKMKMKRDHIVPLSNQAIELLSQLAQDEPFLFFSPRSKKPITTDSLIRVWRKLGYKSTLNDEKEFCTHALRGMFSSILHQDFENKYPSEIIEFQLAHVEKNKVKNAYNRTHLRSYLEKRHEMMQDYANYLDNLRQKYQNQV